MYVTYITVLYHNIHYIVHIKSREAQNLNLKPQNINNGGNTAAAAPLVLAAVVVTRKCIFGTCDETRPITAIVTTAQS
jgi:hypothetical protein